MTSKQAALRDELIAAAEPYRHFGYDDPRRSKEYLLGTLVVPAHMADHGTCPVPERRHAVYYAPGYGVNCQTLCTSNGSAGMIAQCALNASEEHPPFSVFEPAACPDRSHGLDVWNPTKPCPTCGRE